MTIRRTGVALDVRTVSGMAEYVISGDEYGCRNCGATAIIPAAVPMTYAYNEAEYLSVVRQLGDKVIKARFAL